MHEKWRVNPAPSPPETSMRAISALGQQQLEAVLQPSLELVCCSVGECGDNILLFCLICMVLKIMLKYIYF